LAELINEQIGKNYGKEIATFYHGNLDIDEKRKIQDEFKNDKKNIIVATNAF
jgi:superfamily II DNA helicase RecQ